MAEVDCEGEVTVCDGQRGKSVSSPYSSCKAWDPTGFWRGGEGMVFKLFASLGFVFVTSYNMKSGQTVPDFPVSDLSACFFFMSFEKVSIRPSLF